MMDEQIIRASFASNFRFQFHTVTTLKSADCQPFDMNIHNFIEKFFFQRIFLLLQLEKPIIHSTIYKICKYLTECA